jgi:hypothetical protein
MNSLQVISRCTASIEYGTEDCQAELMSDGTIRGRYCGEPCSFVMRKGGAGDPPFNWRRKLFAGDTEVPGQDWEET